MLCYVKAIGDRIKSMTEVSPKMGREDGEGHLLRPLQPADWLTGTNSGAGVLGHMGSPASNSF